MAMMIGLSGMVIVWLWFFAPDALDDRLRKGMLIAATLVFTLSMWSTSSMMKAHEETRARIKLEFRRSERRKREAVGVIRRENEDLGAPPMRSY